MNRTFFLICLLSLTLQGASDIYLFKMKIVDGNPSLANPIKITSHKGYNNQPIFVPNSPYLMYSSARGEQTDIYRYNTKTNKTDQLTSTPESEYSPTPIPGKNAFSVIQLFITDGPRKGAQPLMAFPFDKGKPSHIYEEGKKVGYHTWVTKSILAMFILGSPHTLQIINLESKKAAVVAENIGSSILKVPGKNAVSFIHLKDSKNGIIKSVDVDSLKLTPIAPVQKGSEHFTWTPGGILLMGVGSNLFKYEPGKDSTWVQVVDLASVSKNVTNVTRLAVSPDEQWFAVVSMEPEKVGSRR
ncbi:MAG: hypothetical protein GY757_56690 [bacterium]|nr:hypothetical protein [bacterium]